MNATLFELIAADRAAQLLREAESKRLARIARPRGASPGIALAGFLRALRPRLQSRQPVAPPLCG